MSEVGMTVHAISLFPLLFPLGRDFPYLSAYKGLRTRWFLAAVAVVDGMLPLLV